MQKILVVTLGLFLGSIFAMASANAGGANGVLNPVLDSIDEARPQITSRVTACSLLPYTIDSSGIRTDHELVSLCPEVKVVSPGVAMIQIGGHTFRASVSESADSDGGDLDDLILQDVQTGVSKTYTNIMAFGDVLLAVLGGDDSHVFQKLVTGGAASFTDANVLR